MTNKFQVLNFSISRNFQPEGFEIVFLSFVAYLFFGSCDLVIINKTND